MGELDEAIVDVDVATGKAEGVDVFAVDDLESVLQHDLALFAPERFETRLAIGDEGELCAEFFDSLLICATMEAFSGFAAASSTAFTHALARARASVCSWTYLLTFSLAVSHSKRALLTPFAVVLPT